MSYLDDHLLDGERIVYRARLHWTIFLKAILVVLLGVSARTLTALIAGLTGRRTGARTRRGPTSGVSAGGGTGPLALRDPCSRCRADSPAGCHRAILLAGRLRAVQWLFPGCSKSASA